MARTFIPTLLYPLILLIGGIGFWAYHQPQEATITMEDPQEVPVKAAPSTHPIQKTIIFDLNGVLFTVNKQEALSQLGFLDVVAYTITGKTMDHLEDKIFELLQALSSSFDSPHCKACTKKDGDLYPMHGDKPLPHVMRDFMQGELTGTHILDKALPFIDTLHEEKFFSSAQEKKLVRKALKLFFDPKVRCQVYHPIKAGVRLLKQCKEQGHKLYLLSNIDSEFIRLLEKKHPDIFSLFDGMIISADLKAIKPYPAIFTHALNTYAINPATAYFIDDQEENISAARVHGITGMVCDHHNFHDIRTQLCAYQLLPERN